MQKYNVGDKVVVNKEGAAACSDRAPEGFVTTIAGVDCGMYRIFLPNGKVHGLFVKGELDPVPSRSQEEIMSELTSLVSEARSAGMTVEVSVTREVSVEETVHL